MVRAATKRVVRSLYLMRCGYCGVSERDMGAELTYDHFQPRSRGGTDDAANIVYACHACNEFKGEHWSDDPTERLLHPLNDRYWDEHLREGADGILTALTARGQAQIDQLQLNRLPLVEFRRERRGRRLAVDERHRLQQTLDDMLARLQKIETRLKSQ